MEDKKKFKKVSSKKITPKKRNQKPKNLDNSNEPQTKVKLGVTFEKNEVMDNLYQEEDEEGKSALQGLLRQLGGYDYLNPSTGRNRVNSLLEGLKSEDDDFKIQSLLELCDYLSISTEETLGSFRTDQFVPLLINLLTYEYNPDIMLFATRALTYLIEALPSSAAMIVEKGAIEHFCLKLLSIEYMDVAEQTLQALEKLSEEHALALLKGGTLTAILSYLDFFNTNVKRTSVATAANICKYIPHEHFDLVLPNVTHLNNLLRDHDIKIMEGGALCLSRLVKCFSNKKEQLESIGGNSLISNLVRVLTGATPVSNSVITGLVLNTLGTLVKPSSTLTLELLTEGISSILASYLSSYSDDDSNSNNNNIHNNHNNNVSKNSDQPMVEYLLDTLALIDSLLPDLPNSVAPITISQGNYNIPDDSRAVVHSDKEVIFSDHPYLLQDIGECLFSKVKEVFSGNVNPVIREECLSIIGKILYFSTSTMLESLLKDLATSSFVASLLISNNFAYVGTALRFADILIQKLPNIFQTYFRREGVFYEIDRLSNESAVSHTKNIAVMRSWIADQAQSFMKKYMDVDNVANGEDKFATAELIRLRALNNKLTQTDFDRNMYKNILVEIRSIILAKISTFEFLRSGTLSSLLTFFRTPRDEEDLRIRGEIFTEIFISDEDHTVNTVIKLLTDSLNQHEQYPLILNDVPNKFASGLKYLVKPLKLKFEKDLNEANLKECTSSFVGIEPLATVGAIEAFLWPRVKSDQPLRVSAKEFTDESIIIEDSNDTTGLDQSDSSDEQPVQDINAVQSPVGVRKNPLLNSNQNIYSPSSSSQLSSSPSSLSSPMSQIALRAQGVSSDRKLVLFHHGKPLPSKKTTFQVIQEHYLSTLNDRAEVDVINTAGKTWETIHSFTYKLYSPHCVSIDDNSVNNLCKIHSIYDDQQFKFLQNEIDHPPFPANDLTSHILSILRIIEALYRFQLQSSQSNSSSLLSSAVISSSTEYTAKFNNPKLSAKLNRQMQDALTLCSSAFPTWTYQLTSYCKFLFPYEVRKSFFISSSLGMARSLHNLQHHQMQLATEMEKNSSEIFKVGRIQRQKVRIARAQVLDCARRVMEYCAHTKTILEVEYVGEVGTGVGPTMEFYTLVSHALQRKDLNLWTYQQTISLPSKLKSNNDSNVKNNLNESSAQSNENNVQYVYSSSGLFPAPYRQNDEGIEKIEKLFLFIGRFIAKAIMDDRLLDIPFSVPFYKLLLSIPLSHRDIKFIDRQIGETIENLANLCKLKRKLEAENPKITDEEKENQLLFKGAKIADLGLTFIIPGSYELIPNGANIDVTVENLEDYVTLLTTTLLDTGIRKQITALKSGFNDVFPIENLRIFTINELENLLCGWDSNNQENWTFNNIMEAIACDHHYSTDSLPVQYFVSVISEFNAEQQRNFVLFVTGSTKLPVGGFKNLNPKLTIVRKEVDYCDDPNSFLPSVMTCMNYVKLPEYSSKDITRQRLLFAISEGLSSFHLS